LGIRNLGDFAFAENTWIKAFDWSEYRQSRNSLVSTRQPSSKGMRVAASMARWPRVEQSVALLACGIAGGGKYRRVLL
jgi:hypothetical protein